MVDPSLTKTPHNRNSYIGTVGLQFNGLSQYSIPMRTSWQLLSRQSGKLDPRQSTCLAWLRGAPLLCLCLIAGCAVGPQLKPEIVAKVHDTSIRSYLPQNQVKGQFLLSGYGAGGGLIGAVVDVSVNRGRQRESENRVHKIWDETTDFDFRQKYWSCISNQVQEVSWLKMKAFQGRASGVIPVTKDMVADGALLHLGTDYILSQDCRVLIIETGMGFFPPGQTGNPEAATIVHYYSTEIGEPEGDDAIPLWTADHAAAFRSAAEEGIEQSGKLVRFALEYMGGQPRAEERPAVIKFRPTHARGDFGIKSGRMSMSGAVLEESPDRIIFRNTFGHVYSLPAREIEVKYRSAK
jgi:hypothetical protein